ncbi:MAG: PhnA domain-containing protein [Saprospiraceae bacterium]
MLSESILIRSDNHCELCGLSNPSHEYIINESIGYVLNNIVGICTNCFKRINPDENDDPEHWQCLAASIWSEVGAVQTLSYRILFLNKDKEWARDIMDSVELNESVIESAIGLYRVLDFHKDANGLKLENGDNVVLTQVLNVKGANFMAPKGTIVKKIKLVPDNLDQIEGRINDQSIILLTKYLKKG